MSKQAIIFLGTSLTGALYIREACNKLGFNAVFLLHLNDYSGDPKRAIEASEYYEANVNSVESIIQAIDQNQLMHKYEIVGITSFLDETFQTVLEISNHYGIVGPDPVLAQLTDKTFVRNLIPEFSPQSMIFDSLTTSESQLIEFFSKSGTEEYILKPGVSSGAVGMTVLTKKTSVNDIQKIINNASLENFGQQHWMLQPRILGRLCSLEGYVKNCEVHFLGFSRRIRKDLTEIGSEYRVTSEIPIVLQRHCEEAVKTLVKRSNYSHGYFHCEFIVNDANAFLIDSNMGRFSGGASAQQLARFYNIEAVDIIKHIIDISLFSGKNTEEFYYVESVLQQQTLQINYCVEKSSVILGVELPDDMTSFHMQLVDEGKSMLGVGVSDCSWVGFISGFRGEVLNDISRITIKTNQGSVSPYYLLEE